MAVSKKDIKKLWGLAAGRCSRPGCSESCVRFLAEDPTVIGEMAHVIARRPRGPRGKAKGGDDTYQNLILLCPTHHTEVDKAPEGTFTAETLFVWKQRHEHNVAEALKAPRCATRQCLAVYVRRLLVQNRTVWKAFGPESDAAQGNPLSNLAYIWSLRKLAVIIPNNRRIIEVIRRNEALFDAAGYEAACAFIEHAEAFELSCYDRAEDVPRFPTSFEEVITDYAGV